MNVEILTALGGSRYDKWLSLVERAGLSADEAREVTVLVWDGDELVATGSRSGNILKLIAVDDDRRGEDLTATVISALRNDAFGHGHTHLFLYTKPKMENIFAGLFFSTVAKTKSVLVMESKRGGIAEFIESIRGGEAPIASGAVVMNCNPFTVGHRYLVERAAAECERLYVFVLSEDKSEFSTADRMEMVKRGVSDLSNVTVLPTGPYLISSLTFPTYFLKDRDSVTRVRCEVDIEIFGRYFAPAFSIRKRFVGSEPYSALTAEYNLSLKEKLSEYGIEYREIPRLTVDGRAVSASDVRKYINEGNADALRRLLPATTLDYLTERGYIKQEDDHA